MAYMGACERDSDCNDGRQATERECFRIYLGQGPAHNTQTNWRPIEQTSSAGGFTQVP